MKHSVNPLIILLVVLVPAVLITVAVVTYEPQPFEEPKPKYSYTIGVLSEDYDRLTGYQVIAEIALKDIGEYCRENDVNYTFRYEIKDADRQAAVALDSIQKWKAQDVNLIVGPPWSSMFCASIAYANNNDVILMSCSSTSPMMDIDDNGFRLSTNELKLGQVLAQILNDEGYEEIVCILRGDAWGKGLSMVLRNHFEGSIHMVEYPPEYVNSSMPVMEAENQLYKLVGKRTAVVALSFNEISSLLNLSEEYNRLPNTAWYTIGLGTNHTELLEEAAHMAVKVNLTSFSEQIPYSDKYCEVNQAYMNVTSKQMDYYASNVYDACWLYALSVIETGNDDAKDIKSVLPAVACNYKGITGDITFDWAGDRNAGNYDIWTYIEKNGAVMARKTSELQIEFGDKTP